MKFPESGRDKAGRQTLMRQARRSRADRAEGARLVPAHSPGRDYYLRRECAGASPGVRQDDSGLPVYDV